MENNFLNLEMQLILKYTEEILEDILGMILWLPLSHQKKKETTVTKIKERKVLK